MAVERQQQGKQAELYVLGEILKQGMRVYTPLVDVEGVDAIVRTSKDSLLEIQIKSRGWGRQTKNPRWFQVNTIEPKKNFFVVCVEVVDTKWGDIWVFPSLIFDKYATRPTRGTPRDLDLDAGRKKYG